MLKAKKSLAKLLPHKTNHHPETPSHTSSESSKSSCGSSHSLLKKLSVPRLRRKKTVPDLSTLPPPRAPTLEEEWNGKFDPNEKLPDEQEKTIFAIAEDGFTTRHYDLIEKEKAKLITDEDAGTKKAFMLHEMEWQRGCKKLQNRMEAKMRALNNEF
ncbi:MAG: hypothetical protein LQ352_003743 [Teloschistes flavicans]|nr:MAG: hypothetical protein LQ352_003743 [Teloschistes flavicans]